MAKKKWDNDIDKTVDWGGDASTGGLPVSGRAVQKFIKDTLNKKIGAGYTDKTTNIHYMFADEADMEAYIADPTAPGADKLIVDRIEMEPLYYMRVNIVEPETSPHAVFLGSKGNYIKFNFYTETKDHQIFGENVEVTYTILHNGAITNVYESYSNNTLATFNIDNYLQEGKNDIFITIKGLTTGVAITTQVIFTAINLSISDNFDISKIYNNYDKMTIQFHYSGSGTKIFEWWLDGQLLNPTPNPNEDMFVGLDNDGTKQINFNDLGGLGSGRHNLQYRAYIQISEGVRFYSNTLYRDFIVNDSRLTDTVIATKFEIPREYGVNEYPFTQPIPLYGPVQYTGYELSYCVYYKTYEASKQLIITLDNKASTYTIQNLKVYTYNVQSFNSGITPLQFECGGTTLQFNANIDPSDYNLNPIKGLFEFNGSDKTNDSEHKDEWNYEDYSGTLEGFAWNENSGWYDGRLVIPNGARFYIEYAPFAENVKQTGFTFEFEFKTSRVLDENVTVLDLTHEGRGLLITSSEIKFIIANGNVISTKYKPEENIRVAIVINPINAQINPAMVFMYIDGILTGASTYTRDSVLTSVKEIDFVGTSYATFKIKQIKTYNRPLSANAILDNFILYQDTVEGLIDAYDRNDVYIEDTETISSTKLASRTPIIIITGNVNKLQNFTKDDKSTYVRMDKIEVINQADLTRNMTLINPSMRCQGTSSMEYPRKNFRFYTQADNKDTSPDNPIRPYVTRMFDYQGNELFGKDRLYSFKDNAQPVKCWCLKADYAESSSTHNTGVARLWNTCMKETEITHSSWDNRYYLKNIFPTSNYPCKTIAQHCAEANDYPYDVRTTVDGFPITLFYHEKESDPLIFLGKYNWNNDKSTESVYGFCDIPGFDIDPVTGEPLPDEQNYGKTMECWEVVNGDKVCNLFTDLSQWNNGIDEKGGWGESFEARYPDDHEEPSERDRATGENSALKRVATWINSTNGASKVDDDPTSETYLHMIADDPVLMRNFKTGDPNADEGEGRNGKWDFLDVYKMAAYYNYLMRFGAVDQTVKNAMFTTEDGKHWYYINYDNDTINGVRNDGALVFGYDIDRQSEDPGTPGSYCYAGHESVLWNNLEADNEFMEIVQKVDQAMYDSGKLRYSEVIDMFNNKQSAMWSERTHNEDYEYKYIEIADKNQLTKLQGPRKSHRQWWLSNRFAIYDALHVTGAYTSNFISMKPVATSAAGYVTVVPAVDGQVFGFAIGNPVYTGIKGYKGEPIQFNMIPGEIYVGALQKVYNAVYLDKVDFSNISRYVNEVSLNDVNSDAFDSMITKFVLGTMTSEPNSNMLYNNLSGIENLKYLEEFSMVGYNAIDQLDLSKNHYLKKIDVRNCESLESIILPSAAPITEVHLPAITTSLVFNNLTDLSIIDVQGNAANVTNINIVNCPQISNSPNFLLNWMDGRLAGNNDYSVFENCSVYMDNVQWDNININDLLRFVEFVENGGTLNLIGRASTPRITERSYAERILHVWNNAFNEASVFYIQSEMALFISGDWELHEGDGKTILEGDSWQYQLIIVGGETGGSVVWQVTGDYPRSTISSSGYLTTEETGDNTANATIKCYYILHGHSEQASLSIQIVKRTYPSAAQLIGDNSISVGVPNTYTVSYSTEGVDGRMIVGWALTGDIQTNDYARITYSDNTKCIVTLYETPVESVVSGTLTATFTKVKDGSTVLNPITKIISYVNDNIAISRLINPYAMDVMVANNLLHPEFGDTNDMMTTLTASIIQDEDLNPTNNMNGAIFYKNSAFRNNCKNFDEFRHFTGLTKVPKYLFYDCKLEEITLPDTISTIDQCAFMGTKIKSIVVPTSVHSINSQAFSDCSNLTSFDFSNITYIEHNAFSKSGLTSVFLPNTVQTLGDGVFSDCRQLVNAEIESGTSLTLLDGLFANTAITSFNIPFGIEEIYSAFNGCNNLNNVTFPSTLKYINQRSFYGCSSLTNVNLPNDLRYIGAYAFQNSGLSNIVFPDTLLSISSSAFSRCNISTINVPASVTTIDGNPFAYNPLTSIIVDSNNTKFSDGNGSNCVITISSNSLIIGCSQTIIPQGITTIGPAAFCGSDITSIDLQGITTIGLNAFLDCTSLTTLLNTNDIRYVGGGAFNNCALRSISFSSLSDYYDDTSYLQPLSYCSSLESISVSNPGSYYDGGNCIIHTFQQLSPNRTINRLVSGCKNTVIPNGVTHIQKYAFCGATGLISIDVPASVESFGGQTFKDCTSMTSITVRSITPPEISGPNTSYSDLPSNIQNIYVPSESVAAYKAASGWSEFADGIISRIIE